MDRASPRLCREMKIQLPARLATALHARKTLTGEQIASTVERALRTYYAALDAGAGDRTRTGFMEAARFSAGGAHPAIHAHGADGES